MGSEMCIRDRCMVICLFAGCGRKIEAPAPAAAPTVAPDPVETAAPETEAPVEPSVTYGSNVKEVTMQVSEATVDCGIIYQTDAFSAKLTVVDTATAEMCGQVIYPAAIL